MALVARLYSDDRTAHRHAVELGGTLRDTRRVPYDVVVEELSATGFRVPAATDLPEGASISLGLNGVGSRTARVVREADDRYGCEFTRPLTVEELQAALNAPASAPIRFPREALATAAPAPDVGHYSGVTRVALLIGGAAACWGAVIWGAVALI